MLKVAEKPGAKEVTYTDTAVRFREQTLLSPEPQDPGPTFNSTFLDKVRTWVSNLLDFCFTRKKVHPWQDKPSDLTSHGFKSLTRRAKRNARSVPRLRKEQRGWDKNYELPTFHSKASRINDSLSWL